MRYMILVALFAVGCGDADHILAGPSSVIPPEPALSLTGHWGGAFSLTVENRRVSAPVAMSLSHDGNAVAGWWSALAVTEGFFFAGQDVGGDIHGTINGGAFSGTVTWKSDDGHCTGSSSLSGTITRGQLLFSAASIPLSGCQAPTALTWNVTPGRLSAQGSPPSDIGPITDSLGPCAVAMTRPFPTNVAVKM